MNDDNNLKDQDKKLQTEDNYFDSEDRFTTQDLAEIDQLLNDFSENPVSSTEVEEPEKTEPIKEESVPETDQVVMPTQSAQVEEAKESKEVPSEGKTEKTEAPIRAKTPSEPEKVQKASVIQQKRPKTNVIKNTKPSSEQAKKKFNILGNDKKQQRGLPRKKKPKRWAKTLALFLVIAIILGGIGVGGVYLLYTANFTDISNTKYTPKENTEIYTADNVLIASLYSQNRTYVSVDQVPDYLKNALIATEDSRFYTHGGVDYIGVARAFVYNLLSGSSTGQGASTITQQLSRLLYLPDIATESTFMDSLNRKFKEISIAFQMEDKYTKDQILEMYLNEYYFGSAAYGIEAAANTYFGKTVSDLTLAESAMLAGLPQAPSVYAPNVNFDLAKERQYEVLERMVDAGYITQEEADIAYAEPIVVIPWSPENINNQIVPGYQNYVGMVLTEYANAMAPNIMKERGLSEDEAYSYARSNIASGGYKIYTTLYSSYQQVAIDTVENSLINFGYDQEYGYTSALVTVDRDGAVRAYYGGNENYSDIDMASSPRQPGSNIKPLYYSLGLENGTFTTTSTLNDSPININGYSPRNSDGGYSGYISFTQSLVQSKNVTSVQIFNQLGTQNAVDWIRAFGFDTITDDDYNLSVALGGLTYGVKPYQMAAAFNTFNDNGVYNQAYFFDRVTTSSGDLVIDKSQLGLVSQQLISQQTANNMWSIMQQVVTNGTGTSAACGLPTAGKTGTTDNQENLWFTGMTANLTTSIWMGNLDYKVIGGSSGLTASVYGRYLRTLINNGLVN